MQVLDALLRLYELLIIARALMSWFMRDDQNPVTRFLAQATDPVLTPLRKLLEKIIPLEGIDLSPILAVLLIEALRGLL